MPDASHPRSWFATIFEPGAPRWVTCTVLVGFAALITAGVSMPDHRWWFNGPAVLGVVTWHLLMMARYEESFPEKVSWFGILTRPTSHLVGTTAVNAIGAAGWALAGFRPDWQPTIIVVTLAPMLVWYTIMSYVHRRRKVRVWRVPSVRP
ncbi:hypothetical protein [Microbacterium sp. TPD7012]|uniref:hypothetical protein n=1 Tax=Microbacterium sp. TPD7012 TaxID=2171975 RepID=UPI000D507A7F|nr:hypothetical protein [Microbacterium sp. TPD7012]PVE94127.1 hypothetical protein DC434_15335 [Microbacterium sp. TPD7012]